MPQLLRVTYNISRFSLVILLSHATCLSFLHTNGFSNELAYKQTFNERDSEMARLSAQLKSADTEGRREAAMSLSRFKDKAVASLLLDALDDPSPIVRAAVVTALGDIADSSVVRALTRVLTSDKEVFVRKAAAYALGRISGSESTKALVSVLKDKDPEVRGAAAVSLGEHADPSTTAPLISALSDKDAFVRARAAAALGAIGPPASRAVPTLITQLKSDADAEVKRQIATSLGSMGDRSALPALHAAALDSDPYLADAARISIKKLNDQ